MAGKRQKPPDELVYRRGGRVKTLVPVTAANLAPRLPDGRRGTCPRGLDCLLGVACLGCY